MPTQPTYPGVYIEEIPSGVKTITGVSTSIGAFFGRTTKGPLNKAERMLSFADYERTFGKPHPKSDLAYSLRQFFSNGGSDCYVVRLAHGGRKASLCLKDIYNRNVLVITAKTIGVWGDNIRLELDYATTNPDDTFNLTIIHEEDGDEVSRDKHTGLSMNPDSSRFAPAFVSMNSNLIDLTLHEDVKPGGTSDLQNFGTTNSFAGFSQSRIFDTGATGFKADFEKILTDTPRFDINVDSSGFVPIDLSTVLGAPAPAITAGSAWTKNAMATRIAQVINEQLSAAMPGRKVKCSWTTGNHAAFRITSDSGGPAAANVASDQRVNVQIQQSSSRDFALPMMLGLDQGGLEIDRYGGFRPVPTMSFFFDVNKVTDLGKLTRDQITTLRIDSETAINLDFSSSPAGNWYLDSNGGNDGIREKLRAIAGKVNDVSGSDWTAEVWGYHLAIKAKKGSINKTSSGIVSGTATTLGGSNFKNNVRKYSLSLSGISTYQVPGVAGTNDGSDGTVPKLADFVGSEVRKEGFHTLDDVDLFNLMIIPGDEEISPADHISIWKPASTYCAKKRAFLLIDAPTTWTSNGLPTVKSNTSLIDSLRLGVAKKNAAVFYPRLKYRRNGLLGTIGPSGAIAGLMSRTDANRGVWKAPAGVEADIRTISGIDVNLTDLENGVLNKKGVNCLRLFPRGVVNWGGRTLDGDDDFSSEWKYIPIRRTALFIEESLYRGLKWVVFEPNDEPLWSQIRLNVGAFMHRLFRQGAFQGSTAKEAFFVKCDKETTPQSDIDLGIVNIEVGFAPLKPAEFVIIKIQQIAGQIQS